MTLEHNIGTSAITLASVPLLFYGNFFFSNSLINYLGGTGFITTPPVPHVRRQVSSFVPSAITQPFFELQTPDFAWKFVWTVPTNYEKKICNYVITYIRNYVIIT